MLIKMPPRRASTSGDGHSIASSSSPSLKLGTKRRFPLLGRRKTKESDLPLPSPIALPSKSSSHIPKPGLRVHVQMKFEGSVASEHVRDYEASHQLKASDRLCQVLLSRLQHCSVELITRHDCNALDPLRKPHRDAKPLRYRITFRVERDGLTLVEKSLRSFQEYELTYDDTREVIAAVDRIVGLFLVRHDPAYRWTAPSESETAHSESEIVRPCTGRPQQIVCVPKSRFIQETQKFELAPGYSIELFLRSRCATRYPENRSASIRIDSRQPSPLTLLLGEELTNRVSNLVIDPIDACKRKFDKRHRSCTGLEGTGGCTHLEDGAVDVMVKVRNALGPDYNYFSHRIQTSKVLFNDHQGRDFDEFANQVKVKLEKARDMTDKSMRSFDDLTLRIRELRGNGWSVHEPLLVRLDPTITYCRQTIEAVMERLQSGISDVLEHHEDALAIMTVHKRGQLIYDGFLDGAGGDDNMPLEKFATPDLERKALEARLKERIRADITMVCKDTCALDCTDTLPNLRVKVSSASASSIGGSSVALPPSTGAPSSLAPSRSRTVSASASLPRPSSEISISESVGSSRSAHTLAKKAGQQNLKEMSQASSSPAPTVPSPDLRRVPSGVEITKKHGYMADFMADDENQSEPPYTPSLVDTDSISPHDSIVTTPQSTRAMPQDQSNEGLRIIDDGRRIIYQEQSDIDAIASGVTQFHRNYDADDEPIQLVRDQSDKVPDRKAAHWSLDTRMPNLSGNPDPASTEPTNNDVATPKEEKPEEPVTPVPEHAVASKEELLAERTPELSIQTPTLVAEEHKEETVEPKPAEVTTVTPEPIQSETRVETLEQQKVESTAPKTSETSLPATITESEAPQASQTSQDEQWELVEADDSPQAQRIPVEAKSDTKSDNTSAMTFRDGSDLSTVPAAPVADHGIEKPEQSVEALAEVVSQETAQQPREVVVETGEAIKSDVVAKLPNVEQSTAEVVTPVNSKAEPTEHYRDSIINDFPEPPLIHSDAEAEDVGEKSSRKVTAEKTAQEFSTESTKQPMQEVETPQFEAIRESNDSAFIQDQAKEVQPASNAIPEPEPPEEKVGEERKVEVELVREEISFTLTAKPSMEEKMSSNSLEEPVSPPVIEQVTSVLETVPGDTVPEPAVVVAKDTQVTSTEETTAKQPSQSFQNSSLLPVTASAPLEMLPTREDFFSLPPVPEKETVPGPSSFEATSLSRPLARPRTNTLPERRYSTALTLDLDMDPFDREDDDSPTGEPPKSAMGVYSRDSLHRRQPSAGFIGLREQRLHRIGLRNALVPYRWQALRQEGAWEGRPSTSHSEQ